MAIPKYAVPDRDPYRSGQEQIDHDRVHVVKNVLDAAELQTAIDNVHRAGMPGVFAEVRNRDQVWRGAAGVADINTGHPVTSDMRHRVGSISKTFTAAAVLQQVEMG
jgi:D-alanyl-D-alanine carboxypeptidase